MIPPTIPGRHREAVDFLWMPGFMPGKSAWCLDKT